MHFEESSIEHFLELSADHPVLDVRSPAEFNSAHIPGAINLALFSDEERKIVGTAYKQESREQAIKLGLGFFGPKMNLIVETAEKLSGNSSIHETNNRKKTLLLHCWRGGMRSAGMAWLLDLYGFRVIVLKGGYRSFRRWALTQFEQPYPLKVIGGYTGSGKTGILRSLKKMGEAVIDLEELAAHKGSAFGKLGEGMQPKQEMFENTLALELYKLRDKKRIWVEDESRRIGDLNIPNSLFHYKEMMPVYFLDIPFEQRLSCIVETYGKFDKAELIEAIMRIRKRLGPNETKMAINYLLEGDTRNAFELLLKYYDKQYAKTLRMDQSGPAHCHRIDIAGHEYPQIAKLLLDSFQNESVNQ